jgi:hypothetical protein
MITKLFDKVKSDTVRLYLMSPLVKPKPTERRVLTYKYKINL